jgi:hypothetical protein
MMMMVRKRVSWWHCLQSLLMMMVMLLLILMLMFVGVLIHKPFWEICKEGCHPYCLPMLVIVSVFAVFLLKVFLAEPPYAIAYLDTGFDKNPPPFGSSHVFQQFHPYSNEPISIPRCCIPFRMTIDFLDKILWVNSLLDKPIVARA